LVFTVAAMVLVAPGEKFRWTNTSLAEGKVMQSGTADGIAVWVKRLERGPFNVRRSTWPT
jgi:hypothetical protein